MNIKKTTLILIITNAVTLSALLAVAFHYDIPRKLLHRSGVLKADNAQLETYAERNGIRYVDVNRALSADGRLDETYTFDGVHLRGSGYAKWRELLRDTLPERRRNANAVQ